MSLVFLWFLHRNFLIHIYLYTYICIYILKGCFKNMETSKYLENASEFRKMTKHMFDQFEGVLLVKIFLLWGPKESKFKISNGKVGLVTYPWKSLFKAKESLYQGLNLKNMLEFIKLWKMRSIKQTYVYYV